MWTRPKRRLVHRHLIPTLLSFAASASVKKRRTNRKDDEEGATEQRKKKEVFQTLLMELWQDTSCDLARLQPQQTNNKEAREDNRDDEEEWKEALSLTSALSEFYFLQTNYRMNDGEEEESWNITTEPLFWSLLEKGLKERNDSQTRSRALNLLKTSLSHHLLLHGNSNNKKKKTETKDEKKKKMFMWNEEQWQLFFAMYESLDEHVLHLVKPTFSNLPTLLSSSSFLSEDKEETKTETECNFVDDVVFWLDILFHRTQQNSNPSVRKMALQLFFNSAFSSSTTKTTAFAELFCSMLHATAVEAHAFLQLSSSSSPSLIGTTTSNNELCESAIRFLVSYLQDDSYLLQPKEEHESEEWIIVINEAVQLPKHWRAFTRMFLRTAVQHSKEDIPATTCLFFHLFLEALQRVDSSLSSSPSSSKRLLLLPIISDVSFLHSTLRTLACDQRLQSSVFWPALQRLLLISAIRFIDPCISSSGENLLSMMDAIARLVSLLLPSSSQYSSSLHRLCSQWLAQIVDKDGKGAGKGEGGRRKGWLNVMLHKLDLHLSSQKHTENVQKRGLWFEEEGRSIMTSIATLAALDKDCFLPFLLDLLSSISSSSIEKLAIVTLVGEKLKTMREPISFRSFLEDQHSSFLSLILEDFVEQTQSENENKKKNESLRERMETIRIQCKFISLLSSLSTAKGDVKAEERNKCKASLSIFAEQTLKAIKHFLSEEADATTKENKYPRSLLPHIAVFRFASLLCSLQLLSSSTKTLIPALLSLPMPCPSLSSSPTIEENEEDDVDDDDVPSSKIIAEYYRRKWKCMAIFARASIGAIHQVKPLWEQAMNTLSHATYKYLPSVLQVLLCCIDGRQVQLLSPSSCSSSPSADVLFLTEEQHEDFMQSCWSAFKDCTRTPPHLTQVFVKTTFHPSLTRFASSFIRRILCEAMNQGQRVSYYLVLHLCNVIFALRSSSAQGEEGEDGRDILCSFETEILNMCVFSTFDSANEQEEMSLLSSSFSSSTTSYSDRMDIMSNLLPSRVVLCTFLYHLQPAKEEDNRVRHFLDSLVLRLLRLNDSEPFQRLESNSKTLLHRIKLNLWQTLCILSHHISSSPSSSSTFEEVVHLSWKALLSERPMQSDLRYMLQLFIASLLWRSSSSSSNQTCLIQERLSQALENYNLKYQVATSLIIVVSIYLSHYQKEETEAGKEEETTFWKLVMRMVPWTAHYHHASRVCAQVALYRVLERYFAKEEREEKKQTKNEYLKQLFEFLDKNNDIRKLRETQSMLPNGMNIQEACSPSGLFAFSSSVSSSAKDEDEETSTTTSSTYAETMERLPQDLFEHIKRAIKKHMQYASSDLHSTSSSAAFVDSEEPHKVEEAEEGGQPAFEFQKRQNADTTLSFFNKNKTEEEEDEQMMLKLMEMMMTTTTTKHQQPQHQLKRQKLVVVASLLQNLPNLAGLMRTSEIFSVGELVIANRKLLKDNSFKRISVTAENWVNVSEVARNNLAAFLREKKEEEGYMIVGVEQTSASRSLAEFKFVEKTVLVVGHENCGLPAQYLPLMDACVQIPQLGIIRSLNAHVSLALVIWEYTKQQRLASHTS
ncbi:putative methyltransferase TARBP1 [Balamuthia mandrillaris]